MLIGHVDVATLVTAPRWVDGLDDDIEQALDAIPIDQRRAVELPVNCALSFEAVAAELGCSSGAAHPSATRAWPPATGLNGRRR